MKISDIAEVINETVKEPSKSGIDVFVGLEHYDIAEPVIKRFGSTQMLSTAAKLFKKGDVLIARRNVYLQRAAMAPFSGLTSGDSIVLRVKEKLDTEETDHDTISKLLPFILNSVDFWDYANTNADGTMSKRLSPALLLDYEFDLPPIEEQKLRAEKLWAAYEVKQSYLKMIKATQEMVQSQFIEMFGTIEEPKYPKIKLGEYTDLSWGDTNTTKNSYVTEGFLAYSAGGPDGKLNHYDFDHVGIVLSAIGADCGKTWFASGKWSCIKNTIRFWSTSEKLDDYYLFLATRSKDYWPRRGGAQPFISQGDARNCEISLPPLDIQRAFVSIYQQADKSEFELRKSIEAIDKVIKALVNENI